MSGPELDLEPLKRWGFAPGAYINTCSDCGKQHMADKRAWRCLSCAESRADLHQPALRAAREAALREAAHLMPRFYGVWSVTGVHIGVWDDLGIAYKVLAEYPQGVMRDLIDMNAILALIDGENP